MSLPMPFHRVSTFIEATASSSIKPVVHSSGAITPSPAPAKLSVPQ